MVSKSERGLHASAVTVLIFVEEQYYRSYFGISRKGKVWKSTAVQHFTWHHLWDLPKLFRDKNLKFKNNNIKKKKTIYPLQHLCPLFPAFFLSHTQTCAYTHSRSSGAAVRWSASVLGSSCSPVRAESRPGLDRAAVAVRSQEHRPPVHRTWAARSLIQSWQQRAPLQPPAPSLTPAAPFPARWRGELTWEGRGEGRGC